MVQWRICLTKTFDYQDTTGNKSVSRTPPRVTPLVLQDFFFCFKAAELHSIEMAGALRAKLQRIHVARWNQSATPIARVSKMYSVQILHLEKSLILVSMFCFLLSVSAISTVLCPR